MSSRGWIPIHAPFPSSLRHCPAMPASPQKALWVCSFWPTRLGHFEQRTPPSSLSLPVLPFQGLRWAWGRGKGGCASSSPVTLAPPPSTVTHWVPHEAQTSGLRLHIPHQRLINRWSQDLSPQRPCFRALFSWPGERTVNRKQCPIPSEK